MVRSTFLILSVILLSGVSNLANDFNRSISSKCNFETNTTYFITTWKTNNTGTSNSTSISIPTNPAYTYNYDVDWDNDGIIDTMGITEDFNYDFGIAGTYIVGIQGNFPSIYFNNSGDKAKILDIVQWGNIGWQSMENAFYGCSNLNSSATDIPNLSSVTSMKSMFRVTSTFNADISSSPNQIFPSQSSSIAKTA